jgi:tRNA (guanine-N7-)-methyltransferase
LLQSAFARELCSRLEIGGYLHVATDWQEYADWVLEVLDQVPELDNTAQGFAPRPDHRPLTKFERRGLRLGHEVRDIVFRRVPH